MQRMLVDSEWLSTELHNASSEADQYIRGLQDDLNETKMSLKKSTLDLCRAEEAWNCKQWMTREKGNIQRETTTFKEDLALQREMEQLFSKLKNHLTKTLEEKKFLIAEQIGQLATSKNDLSAKRERTCTNQEGINTSGSLLEKKNLETLLYSIHTRSMCTAQLYSMIRIIRSVLIVNFFYWNK